MGKRNRDSDGLYAGSASGASDDEDTSATPTPAPGDEDDQTSLSASPESDAGHANDPSKLEKPAISQDHANYHEHGQPHIGLNHYLAQHPHKPDQLAGFKHFAHRVHKAKHTIAEWDTLLAEFNQRPVR